MGNCIYCGKSAGLFKSKHAECEDREKRRLIVLTELVSRIEEAVVGAIQEPSEAAKLREIIQEGGKSGLLTQESAREAIIEGWSKSVEKCLEDGIIDEEEERRLVVFKNGFQFTEEELNKKGAHTRLVQAIVIRDVLNGIIPQRMELTEALPVNLQKGEKVVWVFAGCDYLEDRTKREYVGGSRGASVRVMKGVYYRVGAFKGSTVASTERVHVDSGTVVITDKNIYFSGSSKSLRIPYDKIVSFLPFDDGVGVIRDTQTAKPQIFSTGAGWFTYNLVTNLAQFYNR